MIVNRLKLLLVALLWLLPGMIVAQQGAAHIVIVKSSDNGYFNQSIEILISHVDEAATFEVVLAENLDSEFANAGDDRFFVALGESAVKTVASLGGKISSLNAYITQEQYQQLDIGYQATVLLDQPLQRYLSFCKLLLGIDSVGVITTGKFDLDRRQSDQLERLQIELNQYRLDPLNKLLPVLRGLLQQNDVLLMLPRQAIYNRDTLKGVLLTSYRSRRPAISYSPAHVKAGALASIYSSPIDIGRHLAILLNQKLRNPAGRLPAFQFARYYSIATNRRVARALGISLPGESELRARLDALER